MFLHLAADISIPTSEVISIIDIKNGKNSKITKEFLQIGEEEDFVRKIVDYDKAKSFILTERNHQTIIYLSPISVTTLLKRSDFINKSTKIKMEV